VSKLLLVLLLAGCGAADDPSQTSESLGPKLLRPFICVDAVDGHKVTYYCDEERGVVTTSPQPQQQ